MQFQNLSSDTFQIGPHILGPNDIADIDIFDVDLYEEVQILLESGEITVYTAPGDPPAPATFPNPNAGKRVWEHQIHGGRSYNYYSTSIDRGFNTVYGPSYFAWNSGYSKTNPTRAAHGISVSIAAKLMRITHRFRSSTSAETPVNVKLWKQKKTHDSNVVVNTKLLDTTFTTNSTRNQVILWEASDMGNPVIQMDEVVFPTWSRATSGSNSWYYYENLVFEFEGL